jgi:hypothetical protein
LRPFQPPDGTGFFRVRPLDSGLIAEDFRSAVLWGKFSYFFFRGLQLLFLEFHELVQIGDCLRSLSDGRARQIYFMPRLADSDFFLPLCGPAAPFFQLAGIFCKNRVGVIVQPFVSISSF